MARAQAAVSKWERAKTCSRFYVEEWRRILANPVEELRERVLRADAPNGVAPMTMPENSFHQRFRRLIR